MAAGNRGGFMRKISAALAVIAVLSGCSSKATSDSATSPQSDQVASDPKIIAQKACASDDTQNSFLYLLYESGISVINNDSTEDINFTENEVKSTISKLQSEGLISVNSISLQSNDEQTGNITCVFEVGYHPTPFDGTFSQAFMGNMFVGGRSVLPDGFPSQVVTPTFVQLMLTDDVKTNRQMVKLVGGEEKPASAIASVVAARLLSSRRHDGSDSDNVVPEEPTDQSSFN
ncbi:hypothetical protein [Novosphingobium sp. 9]|uniref:hypothetical protein n=1 Tax=Novosphingobium sp. 9 TaxID=2025349 RepID=UPI0021B5B1E9|nr:hypothetical protein [Novosphingobium sp. 9]